MYYCLRLPYLSAISTIWKRLTSYIDKILTNIKRKSDGVTVTVCTNNPDLQGLTKLVLYYVETNRRAQGRFEYLSSDGLLRSSSYL